MALVAGLTGLAKSHVDIEVGEIEASIVHVRVGDAVQMKRWTIFVRAVPLLCLSAASPRHLDFDGLPPVRVGMTRAQAEQALHARLSIHFPNDDGPTGCGLAEVKGRNSPYGYMMENGRITRVDIGGEGVTASIETAAGISLGSSIPEIRRAYGKRARSHSNIYTDEPDFEIKSANGKAAIVFETERGRVVRMHAGRLPSAEYIEGCL